MVGEKRRSLGLFIKEEIMFWGAGYEQGLTEYGGWGRGVNAKGCVNGIITVFREPQGGYTGINVTGRSDVFFWV